MSSSFFWKETARLRESPRVRRLSRGGIAACYRRNRPATAGAINVTSSTSGQILPFMTL